MSRHCAGSFWSLIGLGYAIVANQPLAARLIENMEEQGIIGPADGAWPREVLVSSMDDVFSTPNGATDMNGGDLGQVYPARATLVTLSLS